MTESNGAYATAEKQLPEQAIDRSVVEQQRGNQTQPGFAGDQSLFWVASRADGISPWGFAPTYRDRQLRAFLPTEPFTMGAIATIVARNMGLSWVLDGPASTVARTQDVLHSAQFGAGWEAWTSKMALDFYTQDKGAFSELVRDFDDPRAPTIGINQLDSARCWHTGNPEIPVLYQDRLGKWHGLKWYQVVAMQELPVAHETLYGMQYSALTRILYISQIIRNVLQLQEEKTGGRHTRTVYVVSGVKKGEIENAMKLAQAAADQQGLGRWIAPVIVPTTDPQVEPKLTEIALAGLPDGFSENLDTYMKWFMVAISMGLLSDYGDFAPLPGAGLGTAAQSTIMHMKTRGKGPAIWQKKVEHTFNHQGVVPKLVTFRYDESDLEEEQQRAEMFNTYATAFAALIQTMVLDPEGARQLMLENKLIPPELFDALNKRDIEGEALARQQAAANATVTDEVDAGQDGTGSTRTDDDSSKGSTTGRREQTIDFSDERMMIEDRLTGSAKRALDSMGREVRRKLNSKQFASAEVPPPNQAKEIVEAVTRGLKSMPAPVVNVEVQPRPKYRTEKALEYGENGRLAKVTETEVEVEGETPQ